MRTLSELCQTFSDQLFAIWIIWNHLKLFINAHSSWSSLRGKNSTQSYLLLQWNAMRYCVYFKRRNTFRCLLFTYAEIPFKNLRTNKMLLESSICTQKKLQSKTVISLHLHFRITLKTHHINGAPSTWHQISTPHNSPFRNSISIQCTTYGTFHSQLSTLDDFHKSQRDPATATTFS